MAITFPLSHPATPGFSGIQWLDQGTVGLNVSPFTGEQQVYPWPHQSWMVTVALPPMNDQLVIGPWQAFFRALNGPRGTFLLGDSVRPVALGTKAGVVTVGAGAVANSAALPIAGGTGSFLPGDWLQISSGSTTRLHQVLADNGASLDVFPVLRSAYANGTPITYVNPKGLFRLSERVPFGFDVAKFANGITFVGMEAL